MSTQLQKKLAKEIVNNTKRSNPLNKKELLVSVGYKDSVAETKPNEIMEQKGVVKELALLGFTEDGAKKVVEKIMYDDTVDPSARLRATDQVFKITGSYAPEKTVNINLEVTEEMIIKSKEFDEWYKENNN